MPLASTFRGGIFEFKDVPPDIPIDWKFAYTETQRLTERVLGLETSYVSGRLWVQSEQSFRTWRRRNT
jgi:hypothetical protein